MKTINDFFTTKGNSQVLTIVELKSVKGGDVDPTTPPTDPYKKK